MNWTLDKVSAERLAHLTKGRNCGKVRVLWNSALPLRSSKHNYTLTLLDFKLGRGFDAGPSSGCSLNESG